MPGRAAPIASHNDTARERAPGARGRPAPAERPAMPGRGPPSAVSGAGSCPAQTRGCGSWRAFPPFSPLFGGERDESAPVLDDAAREPDLETQQRDHTEQEPVPELLPTPLLRQRLHQALGVVLVGERDHLADTLPVRVGGRCQVRLALIRLDGVQRCLGVGGRELPDARLAQALVDQQSEGSLQCRLGGVNAVLLVGANYQRLRFPVCRSLERQALLCRLARHAVAQRLARFEVVLDCAQVGEVADQLVNERRERLHADKVVAPAIVERDRAEQDAARAKAALDEEWHPSLAEPCYRT